MLKDILRKRRGILIFQLLAIFGGLLLIFLSKTSIKTQYSILIFFLYIILILYINKKYLHVGYIHPMKEFRKDKYQEVFSGKRPKPDKLAKHSRRIILKINKYLVSIVFIIGIILWKITAIIVFGILMVIVWWDDINDYLKKRRKHS